MKIILVGSAHPLRGGLASFNERLAHEFQQQGNEVTIETFKLQYPKLLFPGKTQYSSSPAPKDLVINETVNSINPLNWIKIGTKIKKAKPDIVLFKYWLPFMAPCLGTIARIAKQNKHTKVITILDNLIPHEKRIGDQVFTKYFVKPNDAFIAMSESVYNDIALFNNKIPKTISPHPIFDNFGAKRTREESIKKLQLSEDYRYILFFGFIRDYKGLDLLLKAFADNRFRNKKTKLLVAGEFYSDSKPYLDLINELSLSEHIELKTEFIADEEVGYYFGACDIVALPYKTATQSGVTQIGFHFEKPMLVTDVGGLGEIIPHNKIGYVTQPDPQDIADHLIDFFSSDILNTFEQNIIEEKKKYAWECMYQNIISLYKNLLNDH